jgi:hypothetical protein
MTKTTNFEISKKLAEIGFKVKTNAEKCWVKPRMSIYDNFTLTNFNFQVPAHCDDWFLSYDLETLLDALPRNISVMEEIYPTDFNLNIDLNENVQTISYIEEGTYRSLQEHHPEAFIVATQNESLADTAGRLIILLHEKNLIKF